jgi:hypothetical protein
MAGGSGLAKWAQDEQRAEAAISAGLNRLREDP